MRPVRLRDRGGPLRGPASPRRRRPARRVLQADRGDGATPDRRRPCARRVLGRGDPGGRGVHGGQDADRGCRGAAVRLPDLHGRDQAGGPDVGPYLGCTRHAPAVEQLRHRLAGLGMTGAAIACTTEQHVLGEGARWDGRRGELLWVDVLAGVVYRARIADDGALIPVATHHVPGTVGAIAPVHGDDGWLLAANRGFLHLSPDGSLRPLADAAPARTRMNDAACDPQGRFWAGTLADDHHPGGGALYRLDRDGRTELMLDGLTIAHRLGWSPDGTTMYLTDSGQRVIHAFTFEPERGTITSGRPLITVQEDVGAPDGLTIDAAGHLWVAIYGGGRVHHYTPDGVLRDVLHVPALETTSCSFAGSDLCTLYVTTATEQWSDERRRTEPGAGLVYRFHTTSTGRAAAPFRPDP